MSSALARHNDPETSAAAAAAVDTRSLEELVPALDPGDCAHPHTELRLISVWPEANPAAPFFYQCRACGTSLLRPFRLCACGCGNETPAASRSDKRRDEVKGKPARFIPGHGNLGESNPRWRGGRYVASNGYLAVFLPDHPAAGKAGYVWEHILKAVQALGKLLPPKAVVHHVDGDRLNNRNSNLVVCENQAYHMLIHQRMRALAACGNASWLLCTHCKEYDAPGNVIEAYGSSHHPMCRLLSHREYRRLLALRRWGIESAPVSDVSQSPLERDANAQPSEYSNDRSHASQGATVRT